MSGDDRAMKEGITGVFSRAALTYDHVGPRFFSHFGRRLVELARIPAGASVLDVAAGRGAILLPAAEQVGPEGHVVGIDLAPSMVQATAEDIRLRGLNNAEMRQMDAEQLEFPDASFDCVLCGFALFFFPQRGHALAEFRRVLKPDGRIALTTWGGDDERWKWWGELLEVHRPDRARPPTEQREGGEAPPPLNTPEGLKATMQEAGFTEIQVIAEEVDFVYADEEDWWSTLWSHGMRYELEMMQPDVLQRFKADAFDRLQAQKQPDGFHQIFSALYTLAVKPSQ